MPHFVSKSLTESTKMGDEPTKMGDEPTKMGDEPTKMGDEPTNIRYLKYDHAASFALFLQKSYFFYEFK